MSETAQSSSAQALSAALNGRQEPLETLLAADPALADSTPELQAALARSDGLAARLRADPALARKRDGQGRTLLFPLTFSRVFAHAPEVVDRQIEILDLLLDAGADIDVAGPPEPGSDHMLSPLYGAIGHAGNLRLAEALLARGARPDDNESLYHATELPTLEGVRLLFAHGAQVGTTNAFLRMLDIESPEGVALFLAQGADPNAPPYAHPTGAPADLGRTALHHAILRGRSAAVAQLLIEAGVDLDAPYDGRSAYALARIAGAREIADLLAAQGRAHDLAPRDRFLAALADGDVDAASAARAAEPDLLARLTSRDRAWPTDLAARADMGATLAALFAHGFDVNALGDSDMPPIHAAAWWGRVDGVRACLAAGARLDGMNVFGGDALGTALHGSIECPRAREAGAGADYATVVSALLSAGANIAEDRGHLRMGAPAVAALVAEAWTAGG